MSEPSSEGSIPLSRLPRSKLAETAATRIVEAIREQRLLAGTRIPSERALMDGLGVGRSTIREAINGLAMLGALEIRHGQGVFVADLDAASVRPNALSIALSRGVTRDLFEARRLIEPEAARLAAERRTDVDLRALGDCLAEQQRALADGSSAVDAAVAFHLRIGDAAHNEVLAGLVGAFREPLSGRGPVLEAMPGYREWELDQHRAVYAPIRAGEPTQAAARMRAHLDAVVTRHEQIGMPDPQGDAD